MAVQRATGVAVAKRQVERLAARSATDVDSFYDSSGPWPGASDDVLVVSVDGKGIVMRPDSLRPATERAAAAATPRLETRLSKGAQKVTIETEAREPHHRRAGHAWLVQQRRGQRPEPLLVWCLHSVTHAGIVLD